MSMLYNGFVLCMCVYVCQKDATVTPTFQREVFDVCVYKNAEAHINHNLYLKYKLRKTIMKT